MKILLVGMNHRTAPVEVRERFAVNDPLPWLQKLVEGDEIEEAVLLSTCNRVEIVVTAPNLESARHRLRAFFHRDLGQASPLPHHRSESAMLYEHVDGDAVRHLFRVAASIDSLVVGEPQILGQVKDAYRVAAEGGGLLVPAESGAAGIAAALTKVLSGEIKVPRFRGGRAGPLALEAAAERTDLYSTILGEST